MAACKFIVILKVCTPQCQGRTVLSILNVFYTSLHCQKLEKTLQFYKSISGTGRIIAVTARKFIVIFKFCTCEVKGTLFLIF
jgi:hypothetical protein